MNPGLELRFVNKLREKGFPWPLPPNDSGPSRDPRRPALTPYLVIPAKAGDVGVRSGNDEPVFLNGGVQILDAKTKEPVFSPIVGTAYTLACQVANLGSLGSFGGIMEFYVGAATDFDAAAKNPQTMPAIGYEGFSVNPGETKIVECRNRWTPVTGVEKTILVHAYDAFSDRMISRFDALSDRHVGRRRMLGERRRVLHRGN